MTDAHPESTLKGTLPASHHGNKLKRMLVVVLLLAFVVRIVAAFAVEHFVRGEGRAFLIEGDANGYWELAENIVAGQSYAIHQPPRYVLRMPGFPLLLAASIKCFGNSTLAARILLAAIGTGCCWLTYLLGRRIGGPLIGLWAALFVSFHPFHIGNSVLILSETLFTLCMLSSLLALIRVVHSARGGNLSEGVSSKKSIMRIYGKSAAAGALIGMTVLVRPGFLPWLVVAAGCLVFYLNLCRLRRVLNATALLAGFLIVMLPWAYRNSQVTGHWVMTSLWSGPSLYDGLNPSADGTSDMRFFDEEAVMVSRGMTEYEMNRHYTSRAIDFARENPGRVMNLAGVKALRFLNPVPNVGKDAGWGAWAVCWALWIFVFGFAALGTAQLWPNCIGIVATLGPFILFLLVHMVFVGSVRYRLPVEFPLSVLTAIGWQYVALRKNRKSHSGPVLS